MINREISHDLENLLNELLKDVNDSPLFWEKFYEFAILSYSFPRKERFSISELGKTLQKKNIKSSKEILVAYYHTLYCLARFEGREIFGEEFNI